MRKSLEKALQLHASKTGDKPEDVIILQITDREKNSTTSNDYQSNTDKDHEKSRSQDGAGTKNNSKVNILNVVNKNSRSHSQVSNKSRVETAEVGGNDS